MSRLDAPDTVADENIRRLLSAERPSAFVVTAGAGSGKTTSLVKALAHIVEERGTDLRARTQQIACITYTEVAAREIHRDLAEDPIFEVSTIHSFLWRVVRPFQKDISDWVRDRVSSELSKSLSLAGSASTAAARAKASQDAERRRAQLESLQLSETWQYSIGSDYANGVLGHEDIIKMVPQMIVGRPLLAHLVASRFPYILVDESQDTFREVVDCLRHVHQTAKGGLCLGFFGDPMQQIYQRGIGVITPEASWSSIAKPENFRSSERVLSVVNAVRAGGDRLAQVSGLPVSERKKGEAFFFVLPRDLDRNESLGRILTWLDVNSERKPWTQNRVDAGCKILMITHRMAATSLGFGDLYAAFHFQKSGALGEAFDEGTAWPVAPLLKIVAPILAAAETDSADVIAVLRELTGLFTGLESGRNLMERLGQGREVVRSIRAIAAEGGPGSTGEVLRAVVDGLGANVDPRLAAYLNPNDDQTTVVLTDIEGAALQKLTECDVRQLRAYSSYLVGQSPYSTQHGTKGAEFEQVLVVLDDAEGRFNLYSYDKLLNLKPLSPTDQQNIGSGTDSVLDRTRRLLYVCVSRAVESLAVVLYAADDAVAADALRRSGITNGGRVVTAGEI